MNITPRRARALALLTALLLSSGQASVAATSADTALLIRDAMVFDGTGRPAYPGSVLVLDGRIAAVAGAGQALAAPRGARVIDARGQTLLPGRARCDPRHHAVRVVEPPGVHIGIDRIGVQVGGHCNGTARLAQRLVVEPGRHPCLLPGRMGPRQRGLAVNNHRARPLARDLGERRGIETTPHIAVSRDQSGHVEGWGRSWDGFELDHGGLPLGVRDREFVSPGGRRQSSG